MSLNEARQDCAYGIKMHLVFRLTHKPNVLDKLPLNTACCQLIESPQIAFDIVSFDCSS